jgi:hypothetical protein
MLCTVDVLILVAELLVGATVTDIRWPLKFVARRRNIGRAFFCAVDLPASAAVFVAFLIFAEMMNVPRSYISAILPVGIVPPDKCPIFLYLMCNGRWMPSQKSCYLLEGILIADPCLDGNPVGEIHLSSW